MTADKLSYNNGLIYFNNFGVWEYDEQTNKTIQLPSEINPLYCMQPYNGQLFGLDYDESNMNAGAKLVMADINSGNKEVIYNHSADLGLIDNIAIADNGDIFFTEGVTKENKWENLYSGAEEIEKNISDDPKATTINGFYVINDCDYFIVEERQVNRMGSRYYKYYTNGTKELIFETNWE